MRYLLFLIFTTFLFTQGLQVDGNLIVTGTIDAKGNPITNVGDPVEANDAVNMGYLHAQSAGSSGMEPSRIYRQYLKSGELFSYNVPNDKVWLITLRTQGDIHIYLNSFYIPLLGPYDYTGDEYKIWALPSDTFKCTESFSWVYLTIFEYPILASGSEQGLEFIEP